MKRKILLIEDDTIVRDNTAEILTLANYSVTTAKDGKEGIVKAIKLKPDLIICDILMPQLNGYGVLQIILRNKDLKKIPFIFMSAKTKHEDLRKGMDLGASDYITKPFEESELLSAVASRLKRKEIFERKETKEENEENDNFGNIHNFISQKEKFNYKKGTTIYCEGNTSNYIFYLISGYVKSYKINEEGKEFITHIYTKNNFFGFTSFSQNIPYSESAVAISDTKLVKISKSDFIKLIKQKPQFAINILDLLSEDLKKVKSHLIHLAYDSVRKKTASAIIQLINLTKKENTIEVSRTNLANLIGIAKETLIRTLTEFKDENLINTKRNSIQILNLEKLKKIK